jgi:hypothetical protein
MPFAQIGHSIPFNNINGSLVNVDNSHYSGSAFTSRVIPSTVNPAVLPEPLNNRQAANSYIPGCSSGGSLKKKKFKNISNMYKMSKTKRRYTLHRLKKKYNKKSNKNSKSRRSRTRTRTRNRSRSRKYKRSFKGGYAQYQNNVPMTQTYSLGGHLNPNESALANPAPYHVLSNCTNCVDNYNHFTNRGFPSRGSY